MQLSGIVEIGEEIPGDTGQFFGSLTRDVLYASAAERDARLAAWRAAYPLDTSNREFAGVEVIGLGLGLGLGLGQQGGGGAFALDLNFAASDVLDARVTFTRASSATRFNSAGTLVTMTNDQPRFDYNPSTLAARGLLIEEARANGLTYSADFANAAWGLLGGTTLTSNTTAAPDGLTTADTLTFTAAAGDRIYQNGAAAAGSVTFSVWAKTASGTKTFNLAIYDGATEQRSGDFTATTAWQRFTWTITIVSGSAQCSVYNNAGGTAGNLIVWGAQVEAGAFATSYIPTVAATVTRATDIASMTGTNFSSWYNQTEGTFVFEGDRNNANTTQSVLYQADSGSQLNSIETVTVSGVVLFYIVNAGSTEMGANLGAAPAADVVFKVATAYKANDGAASLNGGAAVTDGAITLPAPNQLGIGVGQASTPINGHIKRLTFYNTRKTNAELATLST